MSRRITRTTMLVALLLATAVVSRFGDAEAQSPQLEYKVKAAFLYNFLKFVVWPKDVLPAESAPVVIGVLGPDPFGPSLEKALEGKTDQGRRIEIRRWENLEAMRQSGESCRLLFISDQVPDRLEAVFAAGAGRPVLMVGDVPGFCQRGGMLNMAAEGENIRLEANVHAAAEAGLVVSSKLLGLAKLYATEDAR